MPIVPLPVFEADADPARRSSLSDQEIYARLEPPRTIVVRFGYLRIVGEFSYDGDAKPGCGSKLVIRTLRGTEIAEMLTTTCSNSGCGKSVSRREMLDYIENSGGKDFPFHTKGKVLRVATIDDLNAQSALEPLRRDAVRAGKALIAELGLPMKLVEAEPLLGGEQITFYYMADERIDFRDLVQRLAAQFHTRIEMRQVGARDEARLVADYERCGQHCCCKNFLKVLKPVSMRAAKVQKATLDPLKISGRCGRLMCCLRYEDQTYKELKANLPPKNKRVGTSEGPGVVVDSKILVQLALVRLEHDGKEIAVPIEELMDPETCPRPRLPGDPEPGEAVSDPLRGLSEAKVHERTNDQQRGRKHGDRRDRSGGPAKSRHQQQDEFRKRSQKSEPVDSPDAGVPADSSAGDRDHAAGPTEPGERNEGGRKRRRRKKNRRGRGERPPGQPGSLGAGQADAADSSAGNPTTDGSNQDKANQGSPGARRRRRRRRRGPGGPGNGGPGNGGSGDGGPGPGSGGGPTSNA